MTFMGIFNKRLSVGWQVLARIIDYFSFLWVGRLTVHIVEKIRNMEKETSWNIL